MKRWIVASTLGLISLVLIGCAGLGGASRTINVGMATNYEPLAFETDGQPQGIEVDFANELGQSLNASVNVKVYAWSDLLNALEAGEIDVVMSGMSITEQRKERVRFVEPYMKVGQMALIRTEDAGLLSTPEALKSGRFRIGYSSNTTGEKYVVDEISAAKHRGYASAKEGVSALVNKEIDYFVHDAPTIWRLTGSYPRDERLIGLYTPLTKEYLAWAVKKDNVQLQEDLNQVVAEWRGNGFLGHTLNKWIPVAISVP